MSANSHYEARPIRECRALALPQNRPRELSAAPAGRSTDVPDILTYEQRQSSFFRLPLEIRRLIYTLALSGTPMHILRMEDRLAHVRCFDPDEELGATHKCMGARFKDSTLFRGFDDDRDFRDRDGYINLVKTSKRIYAESIDLLYATNQMIINLLETILILPETVLPRRLHNIRSVAFNCIGSTVNHGDMECWEQAITTLASMDALTELEIDLCWVSHGQISIAELEKHLLKSASAIVLPQKWKLRLWWINDPPYDDYSSMPFNVERCWQTDDDSS